MAKLVVKFLLDQETKGALRYKEVDDNGTPREITEGAKIGTLYIRKTAIPGKQPPALSVTVEWKE